MFIVAAYPSLTKQDGQDRSIRKLIRPILAWLAERYSEELSSSVQRGMRSQASKGLWVKPPRWPLGSHQRTWGALSPNQAPEP